MFDYLKAYIVDPELAVKLKHDRVLDFNTGFNDIDGSFKNSIYEADFQSLKFIIYPKGKIELKGSLHKYYNNGEHNHDNFCLTKLHNVLNELEFMFGIDKSKWRIKHLEYGVNLSLKSSPTEVIDNLIVYKSYPFDNMPTFQKGYYKRANLLQYSIKIYDKGRQYGQPNNILRIEKKANKMECVKKGAVYLADLIDPIFWRYCLDDLLDCIDSIIITEIINETFLTRAEIEKYKQCGNPLEWKKMTAKMRCKNKNFVKKLVSRFGIHHYLSELIQATTIEGKRLIHS